MSKSKTQISKADLIKIFNHSRKEKVKMLEQMYKIAQKLEKYATEEYFSLCFNCNENNKIEKLASMFAGYDWLHIKNLNQKIKTTIDDYNNPIKIDKKGEIKMFDYDK